ncbi:unnamed protein product [Caenorhabditis angaria]|uniref:Serpentine receptor class r-10 n=1 Tax=Caenorhabditis angaria TaxID=860376 RepID=A0A9P1N6B9_9PELO|nr:unnamed protein product [Caenorhabditis angaria]
MVAPIFLRVFQYFGFIASEIFNMFLIWLILTKINRKIGSYKNVMLLFAIYSMIYAVIEICAQPVMHSKGTIFILFVDGFFKDYMNFGIFLCCLYIGTFGLCISLLACHFVYRFLAVCHPSALTYLEGPKLILLFIPSFILACTWSISGYIFAYPTDLKSSLLNESISENYGVNLFETPHLSLLYYLIDEHGGIEIYPDCALFLVAQSIMSTCLITMVFCGIKCHKALQGVSNMSKRTKNLNKQLLLTLVVQTLVPLCTMFTPVGILFFLPIFSIDLGTWANAPGIFAGLYPALDALIVIFMIRDFRNVILCNSRKRKINISSSDGRSQNTSFQ